MASAYGICRFRRNPFSLAAALLCAGTPWSAQAQQAGDPAAVELEEIIVTATRRSEGVQDIPSNITAVTGETIEKQKLENLADLVRTVPGLFLVDQGGRDTNRLTVRGLNVDSVGASEGVGTDGGGVVAQYIGDIPLYVDLRLLDLDRVEALLGPQGTLYGAGTLGGAIRYIPKRPQFGSNTLELTAGAFGYSHGDDLGVETMAIGNVGISDTTALRFAVARSDEPGFIDYNHVVREIGVSNPQPDYGDPADVAANLRQVEDANYLDTFTGRFAVRHAFTDNVEATFTTHYQDQLAGGRTINQAESYGTGRYESAQRVLEPNDRETALTTLELQAHLGFATLTSASGYSVYEEVGQRDQTDLLLNYGYGDFPTFTGYTREEVDETRINQELRLVSSDEGPFTWIAGLFYNERETDSTSSEFTPGIPEFFGMPPGTSDLEYYQLNEETFTESAVFGEVAYGFTERLALTLGGRWFKFEDELLQRIDFPLYTGPGEPVFVKVDDKDTVFKANLAYEFSDELLAYATLSEGYRAGGINALPVCTDETEGQTACLQPDEQIILPDKTLNHELGLRSEWLERRLIVNASVFYMKWTDIQVSGVTASAIPITVNAAEAATVGAELSMQSRLSAHWSFDLNYTYNDAELTKDQPGIIGDETARDGDRLPGSPQHYGHASLNYSTPLPRGYTLDATYTVSAQSDVYSRVGLIAGGEALGGYAIHDASVGLSSEAWQVKLYAKNLLDKYAETGVRGTRASIDDDVPGGDGIVWERRTYYKSVHDPLRVGVTVSYAFGQ